jgi:hypothetical protein
VEDGFRVNIVVLEDVRVVSSTKNVLPDECWMLEVGMIKRVLLCNSFVFGVDGVCFFGILSSLRFHLSAAVFLMFRLTFYLLVSYH